MKLSGLEPVSIGTGSLFVNVGERTNVTGSKAFARMILNGEYEQALAVARQQVESRANVIDVCMDEGLIDGVPTIGVQGRYYTSLSLAGSSERALSVADYLIQRARKPG